MAKYRAKTSAVHPYREGDIVEFESDLVDGFKPHFEPYTGNDEVTDIASRNPLNDPTAAGTQLDIGQRTHGNLDRETGDSGGPGNETTAENNGGRQSLVNPSREELKARASELGIDYAPNISTEKLLELVKDKEAEKDEDEE